MDTQHLQYRNVLVNVEADEVCDPILTTDFDKIKAVLNLIGTPDMDIVVYGSFNPSYGPVPDFSDPVTATNEYHALGYTDEGTGVFYAAGFPYNPATVDTDLAINIETTGENWIMIGIANWVDGAVEFCHVDLYNHNG